METKLPSEQLIYKKILAVMKDIPAVEKNKTDAEHNIQYRGIDDIINALHPIFKKHGIFITPEIISNSVPTINGKNIIYVKYTFFAEDGSSISTTTPGESSSYAHDDKGSIKAMSNALKTTLIQMFSIPTTDVDIRKWLPENHFNQCLVRIKKGEQGIMAKIEKEYKMKEEYLIQLKYFDWVAKMAMSTLPITGGTKGAGGTTGVGFPTTGKTRGTLPTTGGTSPANTQGTLTNTGNAADLRK